MSSLIEKYNISERDLYAISLINSKKKSAGLIEKEKLKASALSYLKPYNVKFLDIGRILNEISKKDYHLMLTNNVNEEEKKAVEAGINQKSDVVVFYKDWWNTKSKMQKFFIGLSVLFVFSFSIELFGSKSLKPELILNKNWHGKDHYEAIGNSYRAEISLQITEDKRQPNSYTYVIERVVYENGGYFETFSYKGKMNPKIKKYNGKYERYLWMTDDEKYGVVIYDGSPLNSDGNVDVQVGDHLIVLR